MTVKCPNQMTARSLRAVWNQVSLLAGEKSSGTGSVLFDMSGVTYVDAEGANYIALLPQQMCASGKSA